MATQAKPDPNSGPHSSVNGWKQPQPANTGKHGVSIDENGKQVNNG